MKFIDEVKIRVIAGDGGRGCISFRREKFVLFAAAPMAAMVERVETSLRWPTCSSRHSWICATKSNTRQVAASMDWVKISTEERAKTG